MAANITRDAPNAVLTSTEVYTVYTHTRVCVCVAELCVLGIGLTKQL